MHLSFGEFVFDSGQRELRRGGVPVKVTPKVYRLLEVLLAARPRALSKRELHDSIWPETFVLEANLKGLVRDLRRALGDDERDPTWVKTIYGFGYAFASEEVKEIGSEESRASSRVFVIERQGRRTRLEEGDHVIGRDPDVAVMLNGRNVSRRHARITIRSDEAFVEDLGSKNGTFVGSERVDSLRPLRDGDTIRIASEDLLFRILLRQPTTETSAR